jgi:hypothetical protein
LSTLLPRIGYTVDVRYEMMFLQAVSTILGIPARLFVFFPFYPRF